MTAKINRNYSNIKRFDPLNIDGRLYEQVSKLLDQLQDPSVTIRERYMSLAAIARIRISYVKLSDGEAPNVGATVRKYTAAFAANAAGGRARISRRNAAHTHSAADDPPDVADEFDREFDGESA
jgi:hypothetical protein